MTPEDRSSLIAYRLAQAHNTLLQAEALGGIDQWPGVINRAYYAMFYAALALLLLKGLTARKHSGVLALIDREFARTGLIPADQAAHLRQAFSLRQDSDYAEAVAATPEQARTVLSDAASFISAVESCLRSADHPQA